MKWKMCTKLIMVKKDVNETDKGKDTIGESFDI